MEKVLISVENREIFDVTNIVVVKNKIYAADKTKTARYFYLCDEDGWKCSLEPVLWCVEWRPNDTTITSFRVKIKSKV